MSIKVHEIFEFPILRSHVDPAFLEKYLSQLKYISDKYKLLNLIPNEIILNLFNTQSKYIFIGDKSFDIAYGIGKKNVKIISGIKNFSFKKNISFFPDQYFVINLLELYNSDPMLKSKKALLFINQTIKWMQKSSTKYLILMNDSLFVERFLIFCAKKCNITSICIQDGLFQTNTNPKYIHGYYADYIFLWGDGQKDIYVKNGFSGDNKIVFGYPYALSSDKEISNIDNKKSICILGQPLEIYDNEFGKRKLEIFNRVYALLMPFYGKVAYKKHPGERDEKFIPKNFEQFDGTLNEAFKKFDVFLSLSSTALLDATIAKKIAIQLYDEEFKYDNFDKLGYSYSIDVNEMDNIISYIDSIKRSYKIPDSVIVMHENVSQSFLKRLSMLDKT